ncbi:MAG: signal peptidase I [Bacteroidota bacterium]
MSKDLKNNAAECVKGNDKRKSLQRIRDVVEIFLAAIFAALVLKTFFIEALCISSSSMANTLLPGDFVLVNKFIYGIRMPGTIPFTSVRIPAVNLLRLNYPDRGDVIVFRHQKDQDTFNFASDINFVKRCVAIGGDTVQIIGNVLYVNRRPMFYPSPANFRGRLLFSGAVPENLDLETSTTFMEMSRQISVSGAKLEGADYGPVVVPRRGDTVAISASNIDQWRAFIEREGHRVGVRKDAVMIDGRPSTHYVVERNYLFVLGDNRENSSDSRDWGFLAEDFVVGRAMIVYWSLDFPQFQRGFMSALQAIRWNRIGTIVR